MTAIDSATVFRLAIAAQGTALQVQALLAGLAISGNDAALDAHKPVGGAITLISTVQAIAAFPLRRSAQIPRWPLADSIGFLFTDAAQMAAVVCIFWLRICRLASQIGSHGDFEAADARQSREQCNARRDVIPTRHALGGGRAHHRCCFRGAA
jgi:hypothetical protein